MKRLLLFLVLLAFLPFGASAEEKKPIVVLTMDGAIGPAFTDYLQRGLKRATENNAQLLLIELNTPGGLLSSTRDMVSLIVEASVPVAVYVTPSGAHAASAGTFILYASHIAAMTDGTNLGAATPVEMRGQIKDQEENNKDKPEEDENDKALKQKAMEDTLAFIRGLAEMRGRNADFAVDAVKEAKSLTAQEALKADVIEYVSSSRSDFLKAIDKKTIKLKSGKDVTLSTKEALIDDYTPDWRTKILSIMTDPNIAMILMTIGVYGLLLEFYHPGTMVSGTIGAIALVAGLFAMNVLPLNAAGIILMVLGLMFIVAETFIPSFGILGIGGVAAFVFGGAILFDTSHLLGIGLDWSVLAGCAALGLAVVFLGMWLTVNVMKKKVSTGTESIIGEKAHIVEWNGTEGRVRIQGEVWAATSERECDFATDELVRVVSVEALTLKISSL